MMSKPEMYKIEFWGGFKDGLVEYVEDIPTSAVYYSHVSPVPLSEEEFNTIADFEGRSVEYFKYVPKRLKKKFQFVFDGVA